ARDVGAKTDIDALVEVFAHGADATAEAGVADGAVGDFGATASDEGDLGGGKVAGVREEGLGREEAVGVVDGGVGGVGGEEGFDEGELGFGLGDVGLDGEGGFLVESAEAGEEVGGAGGGEAWGDYGSEEVVEGVNGVDVGDGGFGVCERGGGGGVLVVIRVDVGVHVAAADEGALAEAEADVGEQVGGRDVGGGVIGGCGGAVGEGATDAAGVDAFGGGEGGEGRFERIEQETIFNRQPLAHPIISTPEQWASTSRNSSLTNEPRKPKPTPSTIPFDHIMLGPTAFFRHAI
ncbi:MAG: hypothetical protein Q9187_001323, partial [Circinaria calcarea]